MASCDTYIFRSETVGAIELPRGGEMQSETIDPVPGALAAGTITAPSSPLGPAFRGPIRACQIAPVNGPVFFALGAAADPAPSWRIRVAAGERYDMKIEPGQVIWLEEA